MRYLLSLLSFGLIGLLSFQIASVGAITSPTVSGEKRIATVKPSPRAQLITLKRALAEVKKKITLLKNQIAALKKQIETKTKLGQVVTTYEKRLKSLMEQLAQAEQKANELAKKIAATNSGTTIR